MKGAVKLAQDPGRDVTSWHWRAIKTAASTVTEAKNGFEKLRTAQVQERYKFWYGNPRTVSLLVVMWLCFAVLTF